MILINNSHMMLTRQFRVPAGRFCDECPAGMMDENGNFVGVAAKELKEETGIQITEKELIPLGSFLPSPGGSDEEIILFAIEKSIDNDNLNKMLAKVYGEGEHEQIFLKLIEFTK